MDILQHYAIISRESHRLFYSSIRSDIFTPPCGGGVKTPQLKADTPPTQCIFYVF